jgi:hypothetical protein
MTEKQYKWREALTNPSASPKVKRTAVAGLLASGVPAEVIRAWAKFGAKSFSK